MAWDERNRQKALRKKKKKDKQRKERRHKTKSNHSNFGDYNYKKSIIERAREFPIFECVINPQWEKEGFAQILLSRRQPNGKLVLGAFLVDICCLGLKNTFCKTEIPLEDYETLKDRMYQETLCTYCDPAHAVKIIYGAIRYSKNLGFEPQKDFALSSFILDEPSEEDSFVDIKFGKEGKPFYIAGPDDNVDYIMRKLSKSVGEGNFHFIVPVNMG